MKRFIVQNGKETVIVQGKDLRFLDAQARTPKNIKKIISFEHIDINNQEKEFAFDQEDVVEYFKHAKFIVNHDKFDNLSYEDTCKLVEKAMREIDEKKEEIAEDLNNKLDVTKKRHDLIEYYYKVESILYAISHEKSEKKTK